MLDEETQSFRLKIAENQVRHHELLENILAQTTKTNGRVTKLEDLCASHNTRFALLDARDTAEDRRSNWWKDTLGKALMGLLFTIIGGGIFLILQKTEIVDVSVVSPSDYDKISDVTNYESDTR